MQLSFAMQLSLIDLEPCASDSYDVIGQDLAKLCKKAR